MVLALPLLRKLKSGDGRVLKVSPWQSQRAAGTFSLAAHYCWPRCLSTNVLVQKEQVITRSLGLAVNVSRTSRPF